MDPMLERMFAELGSVRAKRDAELSDSVRARMRLTTRPELEAAADNINPPELAWRRDPVAWLAERAETETWSKQREVFQSVVDHPKTAVHSSHSVGKARPLSALVPTPEGWETMGNLHPGHEIFDESGKVCRVIGVSPVWNLPCYSVTFDDGTQEIVNGEHEWQVMDLRYRPRTKIKDWRYEWDRSVTMTTVGLLNEGVKFGGQYRWRIPITLPLDLPEADLPIAPYVLGAWLGDGTSIRPEITCHDKDREIVDRIASLGENIRKREKSPYAWVMTGKLPDRALLHNRLQDIGVRGDKHIPMKYLRASYQQRLELLRGLMDTDGFNTQNSVGIDLCNERLAEDTAELVRTLGWKVSVRKGSAKLNGIEVGTRYRLSWHPDVNLFHLKRKAERWKPSIGHESRNTIRTIVGITPVETVPTVCIEVDSPRHLYLAGGSMVPTHNSFTAAQVACWWLDVHPPGEAFVLSTAPTEVQIKAILWREINRTHGRLGLRGRVNLSEWYIGNELVALGRKPSDHNPTGMQGVHARFFLVIVDEACGIPKTLWDAASTLAANEYGRMLAIGNPDDPQSEFARVCDEGSGWNVIHIGTLDTPNFTGEPVSRSLAEMLPSREWYEDRKKAWGEDSALFVSKVMGHFPKEENPFTTVPYGWATQCRYTELASDDGDVQAGIDVGAGGDRTVIYERRGPVAGRVESFRNPDPMATIGQLVEKINEWGVSVAKVDVIGVGWALYGRLRELSSKHNPTGARRGETTHSAEIVPVNFATKPWQKHEKRFLNKRAEVWWNVGRENSRLRTWDLSNVSDDLIAELTMPRYEIMDSGGRIKIELKDEVRKRLGRSPDEADALLLAFYETTVRGELSPGASGASSLATTDLLRNLKPV